MSTIADHKGILIEEKSMQIDFEKLANDGFKHAIIRLTVRGIINENIEYYYNSARKYGIKTSFSHLSYAKNEYEVSKEADKINTVINNYDHELPFGIELEDSVTRYLRHIPDFENNGFVIVNRLQLMFGFIPKIDKNLMFRLRYDEIKHLHFEALKTYMPLWYYRNTKTYDGTDCVIWQKRRYDKIDGVQGNAGIFYII